MLHTISLTATPSKKVSGESNSVNFSSVLVPVCAYHVICIGVYVIAISNFFPSMARLMLKQILRNGLTCIFFPHRDIHFISQISPSDPESKIHNASWSFHLPFVLQYSECSFLLSTSSSCRSLQLRIFLRPYFHEEFLKELLFYKLVKVTTKTNN